MACILLVEDNAFIREALVGYLQLDEHKVIEFGEIRGVMEVIQRGIVDLVILDVMLPDGSGFNLAKTIREISSIPMVFLTAKDSESDRITGFELGADDYIEKPYDVDILVAKIKGIFKRKYGQEEIVEGNIRLNTVQQTVYVDGQKKEVTEKEFELLKLLIENKNVTMKKEYLFNTVWGSDSDSEIQTLTVHIKWLREKIEEEPKKPKHIITEWGVGYRFE